MMLTILSITTFLIALSAGQSCGSIYTSVQCNSMNVCIWDGGIDGECKCNSPIQMDILFGIDTSGSIGWDGFQVQKDYIRNLVSTGVPDDARMGFFMFSTFVNQTKDIQSWSDRKAELLEFVDGMYWDGGWTNTMQLISDGLDHFNDPAIYDASRQRVFLILSDGSPCLPQSQPVHRWLYSHINPIPDRYG